MAVFCLGKLMLPIVNLRKCARLRKHHFVRYNSTIREYKVLERLNNRSILCLRGKEITNFLQGLITNDIKNLDEGASSIYSLFLNIKGRILFDTIIYKSQEEDAVYYIECDSKLVNSIQNHLKIYRLKKKIDIENLDDKLSVWCAFCIPNDNIDNSTQVKLEGLIFPCGTVQNRNSKYVNNNTLIYPDPRLSDLGLRILADVNVRKSQIEKYLNIDSQQELEENFTYQALLYKLGIGEGSDNFPLGHLLPLEANCDYLHGVSFHKGCYIGQELTARTYHTGVVRKRFMPLIFDQRPNTNFPYDTKITNESDQVVGKFKGIEGKYGLGSMRIVDTLSARELKIMGMNVKVIKPMWWPRETQKEILSASDKK